MLRNYGYHLLLVGLPLKVLTTCCSVPQSTGDGLLDD